MFSPGAKAGIGVGDTIVTINDWNIEAMENIQVFRASELILNFIVCLLTLQGRRQHFPGSGFLCQSWLEQVRPAT